MKTIINICRPIAIFCAAVALVVNIWNNNWLGVSINLVTLIACL